MAHHLGAWVAVAVGVFTAFAIAIWGALHTQNDTDV